MKYFTKLAWFPFIIIFLFISCKTTRFTEVSVRNIPEIRKQYIDKYSKLAVNEMKRTGIPASITLAQGILESGNGESRLAKKGNNHFGIKCHDDWKGRKIYHDDDRRNECFRKYSNSVESFRDHSDFISDTPRYAFLFKLDKNDYKSWAKGLKKAGYATDRKYDERLVRIIEENGLYRYDDLRNNRRGKMKIGQNNKDYSDKEGVYPENKTKRILSKNRIDYIIVNKSDTYRSIEQEFELMNWEIFKYNDLDNDFRLKPGMILYLQPKRKKAAKGNDFHIVKEGETMHEISQRYGIKLARLYKMNMIQESKEPEAGSKLWLRKKRPDDKTVDEKKTFEIDFDPCP